MNAAVEIFFGLREGGGYPPLIGKIYTHPQEWKPHPPLGFLTLSTCGRFIEMSMRKIFGVLAATKDDTLPCKRQALTWQKEPKAWTQALQRYKQFFYQSGM